MRNLFLFLLLILIFTACKESEHQYLTRMVAEWENKQIQFPSNIQLTDLSGTNTSFDSIKCKYTIVTYIDSIGCLSCKLKLTEWKLFIEQLNSKVPNTVRILLAFYSANKQEIKYLLKRDSFNYPVFFDEHDSLNKLNGFPMKESFRSFLLGENSKVVAIGNPVHNPKIKDLYLKIIQDEEIGQEDTNKKIQTEVSIDKTSFSFGKFDWKEEQKTTFTLKNVGNKPLFIQEVTTSCGCTTVTYSKEPVRPGKETIFEVGYKAEDPGYFNKTITVYCNAKISPLTLKISGSANEIKKEI